MTGAAGGPAPRASVGGAPRASRGSAPLQYKVVGQIGEGAFGWVYYARGPQNRVCAVKSFKSNPKDAPVVPAPTIREVYLLRELSHENVLNLLHVRVNHRERSLSLVFDYAEYDLDRVVRHHRTALRNAPIPPRVVKSLAWQMLRGLAYLHANDVMHRDLKPQNVLIMGDGVEHGVVKIADFGLARRCRSPARPLSENGPVVTLWYRAPELLLGAKHYLVAVDVWAAGCIVGELACLAPLFPGVADHSAEPARDAGDMYDRDQLAKIFAALGPPTPRDWPTLEAHPRWRRAKEANLHLIPETGLPKRLGDANGSEPGVRSLVAALCRYDPERRPSAEEALRHPWFAADPRPTKNAFDEGTLGGAEVPVKYPKRQIMPVKLPGKRPRGDGDGDGREPGEVVKPRESAPRGAAGAAALAAV